MLPKTVPDEDLMLQVREGAGEMLGELFDRYQTPLFNFYAKMTGDRAASEDLVQEVFLRILKYRQSYRPGTQFRSWLYQIARNARADFYRKHRPEPAEAAKVDVAPAAQAGAEQSQHEALLHRALMQLPEDKREILLLSRFQELKYEEIARLLGCETGAVKVRVHRALQQLREVYLALENNPAAHAQSQTQDQRRAARTDSLPPTGRVQ
jgi:RNA polymerase sigma-70 factor (ECF subfamily)